MKYLPIIQIVLGVFLQVFGVFLQFVFVLISISFILDGELIVGCIATSISTFFFTLSLKSVFELYNIITTKGTKQ